MHIYLPIAEMSVNIFWLLGMGAGIGILSGIFGVGGGFLLTPLLIFMGIPPTVAVGTQANQVVAASVSGVFAHFKRRNVDIKMGLYLLVGGFFGSTLGVLLFTWLKTLGQIDLVIKLCYVVFLGIVGVIMAVESLQTVMRSLRGVPPKAGRRRNRTWIHALPFKTRFKPSRLYISALLPLAVGFFVGVLSAIMGVGGGFVMVPAMIYLLGMHTTVVVGTSLFQIIFVTANATFLQAYLNQTVDVVLALLLLVGGVFGAQLGTRLAIKLKGEHLRALLAAMVLVVCGKLALDLVLPPEDIYSITVNLEAKR